MVKRILSVLLVLLVLCGTFTACSAVRTYGQQPDNSNSIEIITDGAEETYQDTAGDAAETEDGDAEDVGTEDIGAEDTGTEETSSVTEDGEYSAPEEVAEYIHTFGHLPSNYISKGKAQDLGWDNSAGNLWDVAPGKSIGGNRFGNYEGILPKGNYRECDVNYNGGYRGAERLIYDDAGHVWYTEDHYETFVQLY